LDARIGEIETLIQAFNDRPSIYDPAEVARAGALVRIDRDGALRIERGYVRREDDVSDAHTGDKRLVAHDDPVSRVTVITVGGRAESEETVEAEEEGLAPLPERLITELTAYRTVALRAALADAPDVAFLAVLHTLCLDAFYHATRQTCLDVSAKSVGFEAQGPDLKDSASAHALAAKHAAWERQLPEDAEELWDALTAFDAERRAALFAYCAALSVNALHVRWNRAPGRYRHADQLSQALQLDMVEAGWSPTAENYLGRVTKARILDAVREATSSGSSSALPYASSSAFSSACSAS
jgi:ParB family chromosome partitioning protein